MNSVCLLEGGLGGGGGGGGSTGHAPCMLLHARRFLRIMHTLVKPLPGETSNNGKLAPHKEQAPSSPPSLPPPPPVTLEA